MTICLFQIPSSLRKLWFFTRYTLSQFGKNRCLLNAAALSYDTLLTIVPVLAISFSILSSFHLLEETEKTFFQYLSTQDFWDTNSSLTNYLKEFIQNTQELDVISYLLLLASTLLLFITIEKSLNIIWKPFNKRSFLQRFLSFWSIITLGPLSLGIGIHLSASFLNEVSLYTSVFQETSFHFLGLATPFVLLLFFLTLLYLIVPAIRVRFGHAFIGALFASLAIEFFRHIFVSTIMFIPSYQIVYKTLAAIPLLLIWLYIFWISILYGAQIASCLPYWGRLNAYAQLQDPSPFDSLKNAISLLSLFAPKLQAPFISLQEKDILKNQEMAREDLNQILAALQREQLIEKSESGQWFLLKDPKSITIFDLYKALSLRRGHFENPPSHDKTVQTKLSLLLEKLSEAESRCLSISLYDFLKSLSTP